MGRYVKRGGAFETVPPEPGLKDKILNTFAISSSRLILVWICTDHSPNKCESGPAGKIAGARVTLERILDASGCLSILRRMLCIEFTTKVSWFSVRLCHLYTVVNALRLHNVVNVLRLGSSGSR